MSASSVEPDTLPGSPQALPATKDSSKPLVPSQLKAVRTDIAAGKRKWAKIKTLLSWFGKNGRGKHVVQTIQAALNEAQLTTTPDFTYGGIHDYIEFKTLLKTESGDKDQSESGESSHGRDGKTSEHTGPKFCIGMLEAANRPSEVVTIKRDQTVEEAITIMMTYRYSQIPVTQNLHKIDGMISWRSIGRVKARGGEGKHVRDCMESVRILKQDAPFFEAVQVINEEEVVLVRGKNHAIVGIVTTSDLSREYHQKAAPFLLLEEIEDRIRILISRHFTTTELEQAKDPGDSERKIEDAFDLAFGEYVRLFELPKNWNKLPLGIDRKLFIQLLKDVKEVRNDVMHFRPDSSEPENLEKVRMLHRLLEQLVTE